MPPSTKLPAPETSDPREVAFALEEAIAHWAAGKKDEALYAVSRAADAAEHASLDERARTLRAVVAEVNAPPGSPPAAAQSVRPVPPSASVKPSATPVARPGAHSHAPPPPSARAATPIAAPSVPPSPSATPAAANGTSANGRGVNATTMVDRSNGKHEGLHVWVRTSARDPSLLLVRLLPDGHPAPPGAYEVYLRPVDDGVNLLTPKH
jgi:hypothetical protein